MRASAAYNHRFQDQSCYICNDLWLGSLLKRSSMAFFNPLSVRHISVVFIKLLFNSLPV